MTIKRFAWYPITMERAWSEARIVIAEAARYEDDAEEAGALGEVRVDFPGETYAAMVETIQALNEQQFVFTNRKGQQITLRQTRPDDAASWGQILPIRYPLPVEVIGALLQSTIPLPNLTAAIDGDGDVHTLLLETNLGLYARYSRTWIRLGDLTPIEQLNIVDVPPEDLAIYDDADSSGNMVNIRVLHPLESEVSEFIQPPEVPQPVTAAGPARSVIIASVDDIPKAVEFAASEAGAGSRWYVARRCKALGWTDPLPWDAS